MHHNAMWCQIGPTLSEDKCRMLAEEIVVSVVSEHIFWPFWHPGTFFGRTPAKCFTRACRLVPGLICAQARLQEQEPKIALLSD